ncbi:sulfatase-like hydrolase/transferase [Paraglaciecola sp. L3A3]|uniref:sulfatase-like hydrolase/transferase n=1 Tax=Paraglaciecola sp. L3A3 TaxID=2686358 RepID=UPI00131ADCB1|nr:sulfatase-like hydrolase/transferase [Paraglaciecola sp. L3A3]
MFDKIKVMLLFPLLFTLSSHIHASSDVQNNHLKDKPNVIIILVDDAGFDDFGFQGSAHFDTPNIDKIATQGMTFTEAYVSSNVCSPSRAGLLTGRYQQRFGMEKNMTRFPGDFARGIPTDEFTIAQHFQASGYKTAAIGKWHVGYQQEFQPNSKGFDYFFGLLGGHRTYFKHIENPKNIADKYNYLQRNGEILPESNTEYVTNLLTDDAIEYITKNKHNPFFMYLSYTAVHTPMDAEPERLSNVPDEISNDRRRKLYAMTKSLDENVGKLTQALASMKLDKNTIIVFLNDNGGPTSNASSNGKLRGTKGTHFQGGIRVPMAIKWPGHIQPETSYHQRVSSLDLLPTLLAATNTPYLAKQLPLDGVNLMPYIQQQKTEKPHKSLFFKFWSGRAHIKGDWKWLVAKIEQENGQKKAVEFLFNINSDPYETTNLIKQYPHIKNRLKSEWENWNKELIEL